MTGRADGMSAIEVEIFIAIAGPNPRPTAAFDRNAHLLISGDLELVLELFNFCESSFVKDCSR